MTSTNRTARLTLPADDQILISREFAAPRHLVYRACTTPELVRQWWGGQRGVVTSVEIDLRVGGHWRYVLLANGGFEVAFHGEFREVDAPSRIVRTFVFEPIPEAAALETLELVENNGKTTIKTTTLHKTVENRDGHVNSGMEAGMTEGYARLDELLAGLLQTR